jgi:putative permease
VIKVFKGWIDRYFSDPDAILLLVLIFSALAIIIFFGDILTPIFLSIAIALLLQLSVKMLERHHVSKPIAFWIVYLAFVITFFGTLLVLLPLVWKQGVNLIIEMPAIILNGKNAVLKFIKSHPGYLSDEFLDNLISNTTAQTQELGKSLITMSIASIPGIITLAVYLVLVPLLVFFFLRDHQKITKWTAKFLPQKSKLIRRVWLEMKMQVGNYVRGKLYEILIMFVFTYLVFMFFGLRYQLLLAVLVALSCAIPYVGLVLATIPVVLVGYFQWGLAGGVTGEFALMMYSYLFVQFVDGTILVPLLFAEAVSLHPIAIIIAILFFGTLWGFWGVFFAIPLATLVKAIINAWPKQKQVSPSYKN